MIRFTDEIMAEAEREVREKDGSEETLLPTPKDCRIVLLRFRHLGVTVFTARVWIPDACSRHLAAWLKQQGGEDVEAIEEELNETVEWLRQCRLLRAMPEDDRDRMENIQGLAQATQKIDLQVERCAECQACGSAGLLGSVLLRVLDVVPYLLRQIVMETGGHLDWPLEAAMDELHLSGQVLYETLHELAALIIEKMTSQCQSTDN